MKITLKGSLMLLITSTTIWSACTKSNEVKAYLNPGAAPQFNSTITTIVLLQANAANNAGTFSWTAADFGYKAVVTYSIQFCKAGTNFAASSTTEVNMGSALSKTFTIGEFNGKMLDIMPYGVATPINARVKAVVSSGVAPIYSNVITNLVVTAYRDVIIYNFPQAIYIAGNYQGWDPPTAPKIVDKSATGTVGASYEGYINMTDGSPHQFKMVKGNNWGAGDFGQGGGGPLTLASPSGTNLQTVGTPGVYYIKANTQTLVWSYTKINTWGIIGSAVPVSGWNSSVAMTFNAGSGTWTITTNLLGGQELKFRANDDWALNFGDDAPRDNKPDYNGGNIPIALDGNYTITLDIGNAGNYNYTIRKN
jgi:starch-binding outer membrane protein SusE/F